MKIINKNEKVSLAELKEMSKKMFGNLVKAVIDIEKEIMAIDAELHADQEACLLDNGSRQQFLWGINIYPELKGDEIIEFDSMINLRPSQGNRSRGIEDPKVRARVLEIVYKMIME